MVRLAADFKEFSVAPDPIGGSVSSLFIGYQARNKKCNRRDYRACQGKTKGRVIDCMAGCILKAEIYKDIKRRA